MGVVFWKKKPVEGTNQRKIKLGKKRSFIYGIGLAVSLIFTQRSNATTKLPTTTKYNNTFMCTMLKSNITISSDFFNPCKCDGPKSINGKIILTDKVERVKLSTKKDLVVRKGKKVKNQLIKLNNELEIARIKEYNEIIETRIYYKK